MQISPLPNPVLLVHGITDTGKVFTKMANQLRLAGFSTHDLDLVPNNGDELLEVLAKQVQEYCQRSFSHQQKFDIVAFSMGGIVSRYYLQRLGGLDLVERFITISSPHHGTILAYGSNKPGCVQMRPNSAFLRDLNSDIDQLKKLDFTSIWTPYDLMIIPPRSSKMPFGREIVIPAVTHPWMLKDNRCIQAVIDVLKQTRID